MQLESTAAPRSLRTQLATSACLLVAASLPATAGAATSTTRFEGSSLFYAEQGRTQVVEPTARLTRIFSDGQTLSATVGLDVITGASPSGAMPAGKVQTSTTPSGNVKTTPADAIPTSPFSDTRGVLDVAWSKPVFPLLTTTLGGHVSKEKDYQSLGAHGTLTLDLWQRLVTLTAGGGYSRDEVLPVGGVHAGLSDGSEIISTRAQGKEVGEWVLGVSRIVTRRWLLGASVARILEHGYLTEPYKVVSLLDPETGLTTGSLTENRPRSRDRHAITANSVYHLTEDVIYASYRWYQDDWGVRSHTVDLKYRHEVGSDAFLQPHVRLYTQTQAGFFSHGLVEGAPLPEYATSDFRLGSLRTATIGATYGFRLPGMLPGDLTVRAEYLLQWGEGHPSDAIGVQQGFDLFPAQNIGSVILGYTVDW